MKLYTFEADGQIRIGVETQGRLAELPGDMLALIRGGETALAEARERAADPGKTWSFAEARLLAPIPRPGKILCSGLNYRTHIQENPKAKFLEDPRFFLKLPQCVIGPGEPIRHPGTGVGKDKARDYLLDYEVELAVVIGSEMLRPAEEETLSHVFGYTLLHDVSARYIQFKDNNEDMGKNFDTFAPMGPCIVTKDEIPDPSTLRLRLTLNGQVMQDGTNEDWCFPLPRLLAWFSSGITLHPGDIISTGTPAGIGYFRSPQVFLKPGDVVTLEIEGIGTLTNPVVSVEA